MKRSEMAAVVAGTDADDAGTTSGLDAGVHGLLDDGKIESVDDDFVDGVNTFRKGRGDQTAQCWAIGVVGAGFELFITAADFAAAADNAAGKGTDDAANLPHGSDGSGQGCRLTLAKDKKIAASHALDRAENILADEFAVHDRHTPEASAIEFFAKLEGVAEKTQVAADADGLVLDQRQTVIASRGRAGEDALADAIDDGFLQGLAAEGEHQQTDAGPAVRRLLRC